MTYLFTGPLQHIMCNGMKLKIAMYTMHETDMQQKFIHLVILLACCRHICSCTKILIVSG